MLVKWLVRTLTTLFVLGLVILGVLLVQQARLARETASAPPEPATIGKFSPLDQPRPAPEASFTTRSGDAVQLKDFGGRLVLINLWATWCAPCVEEMPSLDRLQAEFGGDLTILAISEDRRGGELVEPFLAKLGLANLAAYLDPKSNVGHAFAVNGLPTSILIDGKGRVLGKLEGAAQWDSAAMVKLLKSYLKPVATP